LPCRCKHLIVPVAGDFRGGEPIEWIGVEYIEDGVGSVKTGARGTFITTDFDDGLVVSFDTVGTFCCRRQDVRRVTNA
jgi:hypothetical protein